MPSEPDGQLSTVDALAQMAFLVQGALERRASGHGASLIQTRLLGILRDRKPTMNELAAFLELDKSSVSGLVDRAERRGLVRRLPSQVDGRSVRVSLTTDGRALVAAVAERFAADIHAMLEPLDDEERAGLSRLLERVLRAHAVAGGVSIG